MLSSSQFDLTLISSTLAFLIIMGHRERIQGFRILYKNDKPIECQKGNVLTHYVAIHSTFYQMTSKHFKHQCNFSCCFLLGKTKAKKLRYPVNAMSEHENRTRGSGLPVFVHARYSLSDINLTK